MPQKMSPQIISAAIIGFQEQNRQIDAQIAQLRAMLSGNGSARTAAAPEAPARKRRKLSAAARKRIAAAQKARWAKFHNESAKPAPAPAKKPRRKLSAAARAKLAANLKKARAAKAKKAKATK